MTPNLKFIPSDPSLSGKTKTWLVAPAVASAALGTVRWYSHWRRYAFYPAPNTLYDAACLNELAAFCQAATLEHKEQS